MPRHRFTDTRQRIEEAATRLFVDRGITETSVRDITRAVGISEGALYRHFESKDDLVWQTFEQNYTSFALELQSLAARETGARPKVAAMIRGFCRAHDNNPTRFNFLVFVQHGQLAKLAEDAPTPVTVMRAVLARAAADLHRAAIGGEAPLRGRVLRLRWRSAQDAGDFAEEAQATPPGCW